MEFTRFAAEAIDASFILLVSLLALAVYVIVQAQKPDNYWAGIFNDDQGKRSALRVACLIALAVSSAVMLYITMNYVKTFEDLSGLLNFFIAYLAFWSGAPVVSKALDLLIARFAK